MKGKTHILTQNYSAFQITAYEKEQRFRHVTLLYKHTSALKF